MKKEPYSSFLDFIPTRMGFDVIEINGQKIRNLIQEARVTSLENLPAFMEEIKADDGSKIFGRIGLGICTMFTMMSASAIYYAAKSLAGYDVPLENITMPALQGAIGWAMLGLTPVALYDHPKRALEIAKYRLQELERK